MSRGSYVVALLADRYTVTISPAVSTRRTHQTEPNIARDSSRNGACGQALLWPAQVSQWPEHRQSTGNSSSTYGRARQMVMQLPQAGMWIAHTATTPTGPQTTFLMWTETAEVGQEGLLTQSQIWQRTEAHLKPNREQTHSYYTVSYLRCRTEIS